MEKMITKNFVAWFSLSQVIKAMKEYIDKEYVLGRLMYDLFRSTDYFNSIYESRKLENSEDNKLKSLIYFLDDSHLGLFFKTYLYKTIETIDKQKSKIYEKEVMSFTERMYHVCSFFENLGIAEKVIEDKVLSYKNVIDEVVNKLIENSEVDDVTVSFYYSVFNLLYSSIDYVEKDMKNAEEIYKNIRIVFCVEFLLNYIKKLNSILDLLKMEAVMNGKDEEKAEFIAKLVMTKMLFQDSLNLAKYSNDTKSIISNFSYVTNLEKRINDLGEKEYAKSVEDRIKNDFDLVNEIFKSYI